MENIIQEIEYKVKEIQFLKDNLSNLIKEKLGMWIKEILSETNDIEYISFTCYTPYFNDGDPCVYIVSLDFTINGEDSYSYKKSSMNKNEKIIEKIENLLESIPNDTYYSAFGDPVEVKIDREGNITNSYYQHD